MVVNRDAFLAERRVAILATLDPEGFPYLTAVWFLWRDGSFLIPTGRTSRKARNAEARPQASIAIDARGAVLAGVRASGRIALVTGDEALEVNDEIHRRYVTAAGMADPALGVLLREGDDLTLRLVPERWQSWDMEPVFGRLFGDSELAQPLAP
jgi:PPOX class probable F420-dependent enzyme